MNDFMYHDDDFVIVILIHDGDLNECSDFDS